MPWGGLRGRVGPGTAGHQGQQAGSPEGEVHGQVGALRWLLGVGRVGGQDGGEGRSWAPGLRRATAGLGLPLPWEGPSRAGGSPEGHRAETATQEVGRGCHPGGGQGLRGVSRRTRGVGKSGCGRRGGQLARGVVSGLRSGRVQCGQQLFGAGSPREHPPPSMGSVTCGGGWRGPAQEFTWGSPALRATVGPSGEGGGDAKGAFWRRWALGRGPRVQPGAGPGEDRGRTRAY